MGLRRSLLRRLRNEPPRAYRDVAGMCIPAARVQSALHSRQKAATAACPVTRPVTPKGAIRMAPILILTGRYSDCARDR